MDPIKDKFLCDKYPKIFKDRHGAPTSTAMCWGFECGDGWFNIIDSLCELIQRHIDNSLEDHRRSIEWNSILFEARAGNIAPMMEYYSKLGYDKKDLDEAVNSALASTSYSEVLEPIEQVVALQVKEKFGSLRFYFVGGDSYIDGAVNMAEYMSRKTCNDCGNVGTRSMTGWVSVRCEKCKNLSV
jgi:hypothetical protein